MKQHIQKAIKHPLISGSTIFVLGNLFANFFNFLFNLFMSRNLEVADYGFLASVISLVGYPVLLGAAITPLVVRFSGDYFATNRLDMVKGLYAKVTKFLLGIGIIVCIVFLCLLPWISSFFHIKSNSILIMTDIPIFITVMSIVNSSFLQAKLAFSYQVFINFIGAVTKLLVGIVTVYAGFAVNGAVFSLLISYLISYFIGFIPLKFIFNRSIARSPELKTKTLLSYGVPSALTFFGLTSLISSDIILVKHFFSPTMAGFYAGLSLVGRVIFYITAPIGTVMFPVIVQKHTKNENTTGTFLLSLALVFFPSLLLVLLYICFPKFFIIFFLKKTQYLAVSPLLALFAAFIALYSVLTIIANFYLSIKKTNIYIPVVLGAIAQIVLINIFHKSFLSIVIISLSTTALLVFGLLAHFFIENKKAQ